MYSDTSTHIESQTFMKCIEIISISQGKWSVFTFPRLNLQDGSRIFPFDRSLNVLQFQSERDDEVKH
jgi:hypothetical protein